MPIWGTTSLIDRNGAKHMCDMLFMLSFDVWYEESNFPEGTFTFRITTYDILDFNQFEYLEREEQARKISEDAQADGYARYEKVWAG